MAECVDWRRMFFKQLISDQSAAAICSCIGRKGGCSHRFYRATAAHIAGGPFRRKPAAVRSDRDAAFELKQRVCRARPGYPRLCLVKVG
jgi:hypothetical protein